MQRASEPVDGVRDQVGALGEEHQARACKVVVLLGLRRAVADDRCADRGGVVGHAVTLRTVLLHVILRNVGREHLLLCEGRQGARQQAEREQDLDAHVVPYAMLGANIRAERCE